MDKKEIIAALDKFRPPFLDLMKGQVVDVDIESGTCTMTFDISKQLCHSVDIIQGGFVTAMLDTVSSHAVFACHLSAQSLASLELKVSFLAASRAGKFTAIGKIEKMTKNFAFLSAELINEDGVRTAILSSTAKVVLAKK